VVRILPATEPARVAYRDPVGMTRLLGPACQRRWHDMSPT